MIIRYFITTHARILPNEPLHNHNQDTFAMCIMWRMYLDWEYFTKENNENGLDYFFLILNMFLLKSSRINNLTKKCEKEVVREYKGKS